jgi:hypothetical protein
MKMFERPYTAILMSTVTAKPAAKNVIASANTKVARVQVEKENPGLRVVALICGAHEAASTTFPFVNEDKNRHIANPLSNDSY